MTYHRHSISLELDSDVSHQCYLHHTRDDHLIGILEFQKPSEQLQWTDIEYFRRRSDEFSVMPLPDCINAMIIDLRDVVPFIDQDVPVIPWRLIEDECPVRVVIPTDRLAYYSGIYDPTWLCHDVESAISELREFMDMFVH